MTKLESAFLTRVKKPSLFDRMKGKHIVYTGYHLELRHLHTMYPNLMLPRVPRSSEYNEVPSLEDNSLVELADSILKLSGFGNVKVALRCTAHQLG